MSGRDAVKIITKYHIGRVSSADHEYAFIYAICNKIKLTNSELKHSLISYLINSGLLAGTILFFLSLHLGDFSTTNKFMLDQYIATSCLLGSTFTWMMHLYSNSNLKLYGNFINDNELSDKENGNRNSKEGYTPPVGILILE